MPLGLSRDRIRRLLRRGRGTTLLASVVIVVVAVSVVLATSPGSVERLILGCPALRGGHAGAQVQLQHLYVGERAVTFAFVNSSVLGGFDIPEYAAERRPDGSLLVTFRGASTMQPDGTLSYTGPNVIEPGGEVVRQVRLVDDAARSTSWQIRLERPICAEVRELRYWTGSYSKALVILAFGPVTTLTPEQTARQARAPIWVNGSGFAAGHLVTVTMADEILRETTADSAGMIETAIFVPEVSPGIYTLAAKDDAGHRAEIAFTVVPGPWP